MRPNQLFVFVAVILAIQIAPSNEQAPNVLTALMNPFGAVPNFPLAGLLNPGTAIMVIDSLTAMSTSLRQGDMLMVVMRSVQLVRKILRILNLPGADNTDRILEMAHGILESLHPVFRPPNHNIAINRAMLGRQEVKGPPISPISMLTALPRAVLGMG